MVFGLLVSLNCTINLCFIARSMSKSFSSGSKLGPLQRGFFSSDMICFSPLFSGFSVGKQTMRSRVYLFTERNSGRLVS